MEGIGILGIGMNSNIDKIGKINFFLTTAIIATGFVVRKNSV
jgi:hypothetical protein